MSILVLGGYGMLGKAVLAAAKACGAPAHTAHYDILDRLELLSVRARGPFTAVINCAGAIPERYAENADMVEVNAVGPHMIADVFAASHVVQVSTDCVFSGRAVGPRKASELPDPTTLYARSKLAGELYGPNVTTVRTSFIGIDHGLWPWFLAQSGVVDGWTNAYWSGSTVDEVAKHLVQIAEGKPWERPIHLAAPPTTKHAILTLLKAYFDHPAEIRSQPRPTIYRDLEPDISMLPLEDYFS